MSLEIQHDKEAHQFFTIVDGKTSFLKYSMKPDENTLDYYSTFVPPELRGRNIGQALVKFGLDYAKDNHYKVIPSCPFVKVYLDRHPEYKELTVL